MWMIKITRLVQQKLQPAVGSSSSKIRLIPDAASYFEEEANK